MKKLLGILLALALIVPALTGLPVEAMVSQPEVLGTSMLYTRMDTDSDNVTEIVELRTRNTQTYFDSTYNLYGMDITSSGAPKFTQVDGQWVRYEFIEASDYYQIQGPRFSARFYDYYTEVWDEELNEVVVYDDRWVVEYYNEKKDSWTDADFYNITRSYEVVENGIKVYRSGDTDIGPRVDTYFWPDESPAKITIQITPTQAQTVRYVWQQSGIVASSENPNSSFNGTAVEGYTWYDSQGERVLVVRWAEELNLVDSITVIADSHAQGRKATVTFESITVEAGEPAILDPLLEVEPDAHIETDSVDGVVYRTAAGDSWNTIRTGAGNAHDDAGAAGNVGIYRGAGGYTVMMRGVFTFDTSPLPDNAYVDSGTFQLQGVASADGAGMNPTYGIFEMTSTISDDDLVNADYNIARWTNTDPMSDNITSQLDVGFYGYFPLNEEGEDSINVTGVTYWGIRVYNYDVLNVEPGGGIGNTYEQWATAESANPPHLFIWYQLYHVTTQAATNVQATTATGNGNITDTPGSDCDMRGIVYGLASQPKPPGAHPAFSGYSDNQSSSGSFGVGAFTESLTGLLPGRTYYARAWAYHSGIEGPFRGGYEYSDNEISFTTKPAAPTNVAATDGVHTNKVTVTWTKSTGATGYQIYRDGAGLGWLGDVATGDDNGATAAHFSDNGTVTASDGTFAAHVELILTGEAIGTTPHTYKVRAKNATGESADSGTDTGYRGYGAITYQWQRSAADADGGYGDIIGGTTDPYDDVGAPIDGSGRWYRVFIDATGVAQGESTHDRGYRKAFIVSTQPVSGFDYYWAIVNGSVVEDEGNPAVEVGFQWGLSTSYSDNWTQVGSFPEGTDFWYKIPDLTAGTVYHYRAIAKQAGQPFAYGLDLLFSTKGSVSIYEYLNTGGDADGVVTHSANISTQQFTTGATSHSVSMIRLNLKRVGNPGTLRVGLYHYDGAKPSGAELAWGTIDGDLISTTTTWYSFEMTPNDTVLYDEEYPMIASAEYAIVLTAVTGDITNHALWRVDTGGGLALAESGYSEDGGINWTMSGGAPDYLFEIWGFPLFGVTGVNVFQDYIEEGDWLFVIRYENRYEPYYKAVPEPAEGKFSLQLIDDTTVIASVNCEDYDLRPGSIYINATMANSLEWGHSLTKIRLQGNFGSEPYTEYSLVSGDWKGNAVADVKSWVRSLAKTIEADEGITLLIDDPDRGEVLNEAGTVIFIRGIAGLDKQVPTLFLLGILNPELENKTFNPVLQDATDWGTIVGPEVEDMFDDAGDMVGVEGKEVAGGIILLAIVACILMGGFVGVPQGGMMAGFFLLVMGSYTGATEYQILGVVTLVVFILLFAWPKIWARG